MIDEKIVWGPVKELLRGEERLNKTEELVKKKSKTNADNSGARKKTACKTTYYQN